MKYSGKNILNLANLVLIASAIATIVLAYVIYQPVTGFSYITGLDQEVLIDNAMLSHLNANTVTDQFFGSSGGRYIPLSTLSYAIDIHIASASPLRWIHFMNLLLHLANVLLFFGLMKALFRKPLIYVSAALLFALHPLNMESVAWITARPQLLVVFFSLLSILCFVADPQRLSLKKLFRLLSLLFFLLALFSGPVAICLPLALYFIDRYRNRISRKWFALNAPWGVFGALFIFIALLIPENPDIMDLPRSAAPKVLSYLYAVSVLAWKFFVPLGSTALHPTPGNIGIIHILSVSGLLALLVSGVLLRSRRSILSGGLLFWVIALAISVLVSPYGASNASESDAYLPGLGFYALAGWAIYQFYIFLRTKAIMWKLGLILPLAWMGWVAFLSWQFLPTWENSEKAWTSVIRQYPDHHLAFYLRGDHWAMLGDFDRAKSDYSQCIHRNARAYKAINNIGLIYLEEGAPRLALAEFMKAIDLEPGYYKAHLNRGLTYMRIGLNEKAMESMNMAVELAPNEPLGYYNRGLIYQRMNRLPDAIAEFSKAIQLDPYRIIFYKDRGKAYVWMQKFDLAELDYSKAIQLNPDDAEMWFRRSLTRVSGDDFAGGLEDALMARKLGFEVEEEYIRGLTVEVLKDELPQE